MAQRSQFVCINADEAERLLQNPDTLTVDVRDAGSYRQAHISGAQLVSMTNISTVINGNAKDKPVLIYCYHGHASREYAQLFTDFGFREVYSLDGGYEGWRKRPKPADNALPQTPLEQWLAMRGFPIDDINATADNRMTPLMTASHLGDITAVNMLIAAGAKLDLTNGDGNNALWLACVGNNVDVIDLLVEAGIDVNHRNDNGATSLMYAASAGKAEVVARLLAKGADTSPETEDGFSALDLASTAECLKLLRVKATAST